MLSKCLQGGRGVPPGWLERALGIGERALGVITALVNHTKEAVECFFMVEAFLDLDDAVFEFEHGISSFQWFGLSLLLTRQSRQG